MNARRPSTGGTLTSLWEATTPPLGVWLGWVLVIAYIDGCILQPVMSLPSASMAATWKARRCASASPIGPFATVTTDASCGAVNAMHDSFTALGGMIPLLNIQLGEIIIGGVGSGLYGMLIFVIIAMFVAGLMVGRTPEYLGKKLEAKEVKMAMLAILVLPLMYLGWTAVATLVPSAVASTANPGRTDLPRSCTPTPRKPATTARPSPGSPATHHSTT